TNTISRPKRACASGNRVKHLGPMTAQDRLYADAIGVDCPSHRLDATAVPRTHSRGRGCVKTGCQTRLAKRRPSRSLKNRFSRLRQGSRTPEFAPSASFHTPSAEGV